MRNKILIVSMLSELFPILQHFNKAFAATPDIHTLIRAAQCDRSLLQQLHVFTSTGAVDGKKDFPCGSQALNQQPSGQTPASFTSRATATTVSPLWCCTIMKASFANESEFLQNWPLARSAGRRRLGSLILCIVYSEFHQSDGDLLSVLLSLTTL